MQEEHQPNMFDTPSIPKPIFEKESLAAFTENLQKDENYPSFDFNLPQLNSLNSFNLEI